MFYNYFQRINRFVVIGLLLCRRIGTADGRDGNGNIAKVSGFGFGKIF